MRHVNERPQSFKGASKALDAPADYQPYRRFHKRNPAPTWKDVADAARAAQRRRFTPPIAAE